MSASAQQTPQLPPSKQGRAIRQPVADPILELRWMAAGTTRLLPTLAHAQAAVAHIDQLIANLRETHEQLHDARNDLFVSEIRARALARELESLKEL